MKEFSYSSEFEKELKKLSKKYPSLGLDISDLKPILISNPVGIGKNFTIIHSSPSFDIIKVRVHCQFLRSRVIRLIYIYYKNTDEFLYIEIYHKGDKENEDRKRINEYIKNTSL